MDKVEKQMRQPLINFDGFYCILFDFRNPRLLSILKIKADKFIMKFKV